MEQKRERQRYMRGENKKFRNIGQLTDLVDWWKDKCLRYNGGGIRLQTPAQCGLFCEDFANNGLCLLHWITNTLICKLFVLHRKCGVLKMQLVWKNIWILHLLLSLWKFTDTNRNLDWFCYPFPIKAVWRPVWIRSLISNQFFVFWQTDRLLTRKTVHKWHQHLPGRESRTVYARGWGWDIIMTNKLVNIYSDVIMWLHGGSRAPSSHWWKGGDTRGLSFVGVAKCNYAVNMLGNFRLISVYWHTHVEGKLELLYSPSV